MKVLESGVQLSLWGVMPEYHLIDPLLILESRITLHVPALGLEADLTLESGRLFISSPAVKGQKFEAARVRVRFKEEIWDLTLLDPETEVCIDLFGYYGEGVAFSKEPGGISPTTEVYLGLLKGRAGLKVKFNEYPELVAPTYLDWESASQEKLEPKKIMPERLEWWSKTAKDNEMSKLLQAAAVHYADRFNKPEGARLDVVFYSAMQDPAEQPGRRIFALRACRHWMHPSILSTVWPTMFPP